MNQKDFDPASWWYQEGDETHGPVNAAELRRLASARKVQPDSLVWREDYGDEWRTLDESGLLVAASAPAHAEVSESWKRIFAHIDAAEKPSHADVWGGGAKRTQYPFSVFGFFFGAFYYLYLRMWHKALLILALDALVGGVFNLLRNFVSHSWIVSLLSLIPMLFCGRYAKHDYYRLKVHGEIMWPWRPLRRLENIWLACAVTTGAYVVMMLVPVEAWDKPDVLADMSGVWSTTGLTVSIDLAGAQPKIVLNNRPFDVFVKKADSLAGVVVLTSPVRPNDPVTLRQVWGDERHKSFRVALDLDGRSTTLGYLRPLGSNGQLPWRQAATNAASSGITFTRNGRVIARGPAPPATTQVAENDGSDDAGISGSYCSIGKNILEQQTFNFRAQNIPVDSALDAVVNDDNFEYKMFMMASIRDLYKDPDTMRESLNSGSWMRACISAVRGF